MLNRRIDDGGPQRPDDSTDNGSYADSYADTSAIDEKADLGTFIKENRRLDLDNQRLAAWNLKLAAENQKLTAENQKLVVENQKLAAENRKLAGENQKLAAENQKLAAGNQLSTEGNKRLASEVQTLATTTVTSGCGTNLRGVSIGDSDYSELLAIPAERMAEFDQDLKELLRWIYGSKPLPKRYHHENQEFGERQRVLVRRLRSMLAKYDVHYGCFNDEVFINDERFIDNSLSDADRLVGLASHWRGELNHSNMLEQHRRYLAVQTVVGLAKWRNVCS
ncbi:hypothetical protein BDZ91DRAFT_750605 [Kalaharituber pfeilii]|nr:hypothetical protein BDZ91DRAFT_750605 [Kalaharituber pfeilii]